MSLTWVTAVLDDPLETAAASEVFWSALTGTTMSPRRGSQAEFATLVPDEGDAYLKVQQVGRSVPSALHLDLHLDLHSDDALASVARAEELGATTSHSEPGLVVCGSPGGFSFCVVEGVAGRPPSPQRWEGGRSLVDQVCLDIPPTMWESECGFWQALTGWERVRSGEFDRLARPPKMPLAFLLQRLDDEQPTVTAHLDLSCDDREAECARHLRLGAELVRRTPGWTVMRDPAGREYCVTGRKPGDV